MNQNGWNRFRLAGKLKHLFIQFFFRSRTLNTTKNSKLILNLYLTSVDESIQTIDPIYISAIYFLTRFVNVLIQFFFPQYLIHKQLLKCQSINFNACDVYCIPCILTLHTTNNNSNSEVNDDCADMWLIRITAAFDWKTHPMYHKYNRILERKNMNKNPPLRSECPMFHFIYQLPIYEVECRGMSL